MTTQNFGQLPWWLQPGPDHCAFCLHLYHGEAGSHCSLCDRPVCPGCMIEIRAIRGIVCPECHATVRGEAAN